MAGVFSDKPDSELISLSDQQMDEHLKIGKYDGELYWKGKKIKRGGFTLTDGILLGTLSLSVLFLANLHNIKTNVCDNFKIWCSIPAQIPPTDLKPPDAGSPPDMASPPNTLPGK